MARTAARRAAHADTRDQAEGPSPAVLATMSDVFTLQRAVFVDWPLMMAMEGSRFAMNAFDAGVRHWCALAACRSYPDVIAENGRYARRSAEDLADEIDVITRESALTLNVH